MRDIHPTTASDLDRAAVLALYASVGWTAYTNSPDVLERALAGSSHLVVAQDGDELIGLARVVSDGATIAYLQDVLVRPDQQRRGLGRRLIDAAMEPYAHVRQKVLLTDDEVSTRAFYERLGWRAAGDVDLCAYVRFDS